MSESEKKDVPPPAVERANALLDRVRKLGGEFSKERYQLDRPFDNAAARTFGFRAKDVA